MNEGERREGEEASSSSSWLPLRLQPAHLQLCFRCSNQLHIPPQQPPANLAMPAATAQTLWATCAAVGLASGVVGYVSYLTRLQSMWN